MMSKTLGDKFKYKSQIKYEKNLEKGSPKSINFENDALRKINKTQFDDFNEQSNELNNEYSDIVDNKPYFKFPISEKKKMLRIINVEQDSPSEKSPLEYADWCKYFIV